MSNFNRVLRLLLTLFAVLAIGALMASFFRGREAFEAFEGYGSVMNAHKGLRGTFEGTVYMWNDDEPVPVSVITLTFDGNGKGTSSEKMMNGKVVGTEGSFVYNEQFIATLQPNGSISDPVTTHGVSSYVINNDHQLTLTFSNLEDALPVRLYRKMELKKK